MSELTFVIDESVPVIQNIHLAHQTLLVDELDTAKLAGVVGTQLLELVQREIVSVDLKNELCVEVSPLGNIVDWVSVDLLPRIFGWIAEVMWNCVFDFPRAAFSIVKMLANIRKLLRDAVFEIVLQADLQSKYSR